MKNFVSIALLLIVKVAEQPHSLPSLPSHPARPMIGTHPYPCLPSRPSVDPKNIARLDTELSELTTLSLDR